MIDLRSLLGSAALLIAIGTMGLASPSTAGVMQLIPQPTEESLLVQAQNKKGANCYQNCLSRCRAPQGCPVVCSKRCG